METKRLLLTLFLSNIDYITIIFYDFINLTQVHNFTVNTQDIFTLGRLSLFSIT